MLPEPHGDRFLDDLLTVRDREELAFHGVTRHREFVVASDEILPRQGLRPVEECGERGRLERAEVQIQPLGKAQRDARPGSRGLVALEGNAPVDVLDPAASEGFDLLPEQAFEPEEAGRGIAQHHFSLSPLLSGFGAADFGRQNAKRHHLPYSLSTRIFSLCASMIVCEI